MSDNTITEDDLETVDHYMGVCIECRICTSEYAESADCSFYMNKDGWQLIDGSTYCPDCAAIELQRRDDEKAEAA